MNYWRSGERRRMPKADGVAMMNYIYHPGIQIKSFPIPSKPRVCPLLGRPVDFGEEREWSLEEVTSVG